MPRSEGCLAGKQRGRQSRKSSLCGVGEGPGEMHLYLSDSASSRLLGGRTDVLVPPRGDTVEWGGGAKGRLECGSLGRDPEEA